MRYEEYAPDYIYKEPNINGATLFRSILGFIDFGQFYVVYLNGPLNLPVTGSRVK